MNSIGLENMTEQLARTKDWVDILQALATPAIAFAGICIAWAQWRINKAHLKHELFEKRYAIYRGATDYLSSIMRHGKALEDEQFKFRQSIQGSKFIFDSDVCGILDDIWSKSVDLECIQFELQDLPVGEERSKNCRLATELKKQLRHTLEPLTDACEKYLKLSHK